MTRLAILMACMQRLAVAQAEVVPQDVTPPYNVDAMSFASTASKQSRLDVFVQVPYEDLAFVKREDAYDASYEMTIDVLDSTGRLVSEKLWTEEVRTATFEESVSSQGYSLVERVFEVPPGLYSIVTIVRDAEKGQNQRLARELRVSDYSTSQLSLSDIMLVSKINMNGDKRTIVPSVSPNVGLIPEAFHIFFEAYNTPPIDSVKFLVDILDRKKEKKVQLAQFQKLVPGRNQVFIRIKSDSLPIGQYKIYVRAFPVPDTPSSLQEPLASTSRAFAVHWQGMPTSIKDINLAIEESIYEAKDTEMTYMRAGKTPEEKQKRFLEFWKKRDPNPNTPRNEKMEAYFKRVEYANRTFKHYLEGWRTDMGMVYIVFGAPNNVDRHPFDIDAKPYEVWSYYDLNRVFVFVDETGFGDYRLTTPIWDVWQRPRD